MTSKASLKYIAKSPFMMMNELLTLSHKRRAPEYNLIKVYILKQLPKKGIPYFKEIPPDYNGAKNRKASKLFEKLLLKRFQY